MAGGTSIKRMAKGQTVTAAAASWEYIIYDSSRNPGERVLDRIYMMKNSKSK